MAAKPVVFVIGASGTVGSATISALAGKYAETVEIRAGTRDPDKAPDSIKVPGVTIVQATMGEKEQLLDTFKGVDALFIVTPPVQKRALMVMKTAEAAKEAGVKFIMAVSTPPAADPNKAPLFGKEFHEIEVRLSKLGVQYCILRLPGFMENLWGYKATIASQSTFFGPLAPDTLLRTINNQDTGKAAAAILTDYSKHNGKTYGLYSDFYTSTDVAAAFSEALGKEVKYVQVTVEGIVERMRGRMEDWQLEGLKELMTLTKNDDPLLAEQADFDTLKSLTGEEPTTMKEFVKKIAPAFK
uniref:NmrA-like family domain-containing protein 1 n=1 Tax=Amphimedon queenslandica TaxID=400682 RepID=A0A1X7U3T2_AMPQE